ncbi:beta-phosphoglucomutase [Cellulomonas fimi]|uniref:Beta-phosphoglucomutase n=1 Tax=Cellulomonas fimi (strain ATCC 484 / DSM 20113 / JCM 1341 / CCUG 24087 / LMG 16345 / NBRC 15513 / NCIMB 8980 / NCTC 7547 / NRS-133) TaxID=590998 RepID=F4GYI4_CELFA|nr:beta-phosphoglucomutase [Cellulomonas fimi]AEE47101.1 beta-phosphoglucomutase [Cellulomonas fimi ATCC 484]NNH07328.1 beta-phosphoglucomutase [Cellulomonas fimi]VEH35249.1 Putative beta-phosphoglucomutase [Cellulomonas fimi]
MSGLRGLVFDLDGVLVHTDELHFQAWLSIAERLGIPFTRHDNDRLRGVSRMESLDIVLSLGTFEVSATEKQVLADDKNRVYRELLDGLTPQDVTDEVRSTLATLRDRGLRLAIGSSSRNAKLILDKVGLRDWFDAISDGENITRSKPDPEVFLRAAEFLALTPAQCAVVEDARAGVDAAVAGGFTCFGIGDAATHPRVTWSIESLSDMLDHIEN